MNSKTRKDCRWQIIGLLLFLGAATLGCNPLQTIAFFTIPETPAPPLSGTEITEKMDKPKVAIFTSWADGRTNHSLLSIDQELPQELERMLNKRFKDASEEVKILKFYKIRNYKAEHPGWELKTMYEIGKELEVDFVIALQIRKMSLYEPKSHNMIYRGTGEIKLSLTDTNLPPETGPVYLTDYIAAYPKYGHKIVEHSEPIFRRQFVKRMAEEISRHFAPYPRKVDQFVDR
ncbi:MAG: hypothetical protein ACFCD0_03105 [Gemmataceae bacterium]